MNLIPKIAEMLGVEVGEEFKLKQTSGDIKSAKYRFRNIGDQIIYERTDFCGGWTMCSAEGYVYWGAEHIRVTDLPFEDDDMHYHHKYCGNCFRTEAEAEREKYNIYEKLTGKKWEE